MSEVMQLSIMETAKVKTAQRKLKGSPVEWVSVIETPVENFIRKNEFVLSTGVGCGQDPELLKEFVIDVMDSGATALAFATGRFVYDIPDNILEMAEEQGFIIIDIPWEIRFSDILQLVMEKLNSVNREQLKQTEHIQQQLIHLVLRGKSFNEILQYLYHHLQMPLAMLDRKGELLTQTHFNKGLLDNLLSELHDKFQGNQSAVGTDHPLYQNLVKLPRKPQSIYAMAIESNGYLQGYLLLGSESQTFLYNPMVMHILEHATTAAALCFLKQNTIEETELRIKDDFLLNMVKGKLFLDEDIYHRAAFFDYDLELPYTCIIGELKNLPEIYRDHSSTRLSFDEWLRGMNYYIQKEINQSGETLQRRLMTAFDDQTIIIFLESSGGNQQAFVNDFLDSVERRLHSLLPGLTVLWGIGTHKDGIEVFDRSYEKATMALDIGKRQNRSGERTFFADTQMNRLLLTIADHQEIKDMTSGIINPIIDYDKKRDMDLIGTFMAYNRNKGNVSQTARILNLHRQSLLYRLRKIEALTELSLVNADDLFLLELSIRLWTLGDLKKRQI